MNKFDLLITKILLKICEILTRYGKEASSTDIYVIRREIEKLEEK